MPQKNFVSKEYCRIIGIGRLYRPKGRSTFILVPENIMKIQKITSDTKRIFTAETRKLYLFFGEGGSCLVPFKYRFPHP